MVDALSKGCAWPWEGGEEWVKRKALAVCASVLALALWFSVLFRRDAFSKDFFPHRNNTHYTRFSQFGCGWGFSNWFYRFGFRINIWIGMPIQMRLELRRLLDSLNERKDTYSFINEKEKIRFTIQVIRIRLSTIRITWPYVSFVWVIHKPSSG